MPRQWVILQLASHPWKSPEGQQKRVVPSHIQLVRNGNLRAWPAKWAVHDHRKRFSWTGALTAVWENCPAWRATRQFLQLWNKFLAHETRQSSASRRLSSGIEPDPTNATVEPAPTQSSTRSNTHRSFCPWEHHPEQQHKKTTNTDDQTRRDHRCGPRQWQRQRGNSQNASSGSKHIQNITWTSVQWQWIVLRLMQYPTYPRVHPWCRTVIVGLSSACRCMPPRELWHLLVLHTQLTHNIPGSAEPFDILPGAARQATTTPPVLLDKRTRRSREWRRQRRSNKNQKETTPRTVRK